jgi:hypothetical protein
MSDPTLPPMPLLPPTLSAEEAAIRIRLAAGALNEALRQAADRGVGCDIDIRLSECTRSLVIHEVRVRPYRLL